MVAFFNAAFGVGLVQGDGDGAGGGVADFLDVEAERKLKRLSTALEPIMIILMGIVVGFISVSILMPLFKLSAVAGGGA